MNANVSAAPLPRWIYPATVGLILAFFLCRNLPWNLDDYDQAKQAYVSFEMVHEGHWWYQHTPVGKAATKPPLAGWISAGQAPLSCAAPLVWGECWALACPSAPP